MRQLVALAAAIHVRNTKKEYYRSKFLATLNNAEILPLDEVLGVQSDNDESAFDSKTDAQLERLALKKLEERQKSLGQRRIIDKN